MKQSQYVLLSINKAEIWHLRDRNCVMNSDWKLGRFARVQNHFFLAVGPLKKYLPFEDLEPL